VRGRVDNVPLAQNDTPEEKADHEEIRLLFYLVTLKGRSPEIALQTKGGSAQVAGCCEQGKLFEKELGTGRGVQELATGCGVPVMYLPVRCDTNVPIQSLSCRAET
jgi:hypothetical protein